MGLNIGIERKVVLNLRDPGRKLVKMLVLSELVRGKLALDQ